MYLIPIVELLLPGDGMVQPLRRRALKAGTHRHAHAMPLAVKRAVLDEERPGSYEGHVALKDRPEIQKLIEGSLAHELTEPCHALAGRKEAAVLVDFVGHVSELHQLENPTVLAKAILFEEDRAADVKKRPDGYEGVDRKGDDKRHDRDNDVNPALSVASVERIALLDFLETLHAHAVASLGERVDEGGFLIVKRREHIVVAEESGELGHASQRFPQLPRMIGDDENIARKQHFGAHFPYALDTLLDFILGDEGFLD